MYWVHLCDQVGVPSYVKSCKAMAHDPRGATTRNLAIPVLGKWWTLAKQFPFQMIGYI